MHGFMNILLNVIAYVQPGVHNEQETGGLGASTAHIIAFGIFHYARCVTIFRTTASVA